MEAIHILIDSDMQCDFADAFMRICPNLSVEAQNALLNLIQEVAKAQAELTRAETLKELGEWLQENGMIGDFGLCVNMDKWDEALKSLLKGEMPEGHSFENIT